MLRSRSEEGKKEFIGLGTHFSETAKPRRFTPRGNNIPDGHMEDVANVVEARGRDHKRILCQTKNGIRPAPGVSWRRPRQNSQEGMHLVMAAAVTPNWLTIWKNWAK